MATAKIDQGNGPNCPICLDDFKSPRELPCAHAFCQSCLHSYIIAEVKKQPTLNELDCPICKHPASLPRKDTTFQEWASLFPPSTVFEKKFKSKSKLDCLCEACNSEGVSITAEGFCVVCKEAMCGNCIKFHKKQKLLKHHNILPMEEISGNLQNVIKYAKGFTCSEHNEEEVQFYCRHHKVACCGSCSFRHHITCSNVVDLQKEISGLMQEINSLELIENLINVEKHIKDFIEMNESSIRELETKMQGISEQIRELKRRINAALDDLEKRVMTEGYRIYSEQMIVKQEENQRCLLLLQAVRNSCINFQRINEFGTDVQKFLTAEKITSHLEAYYKQVREKYEHIDSTTVTLMFDSKVESILSMPSSDYGKLVTSTSSKRLCLKMSHFQTIKLGKDESWIRGVTSLSGNRLIMADYYAKKCILLNASYDIIASSSGKNTYVGICVSDEEEVAVSTEGKDIHILSVRNDIISPVRTISARHGCTGVSAVGKGHIAITGNCDLKSCFWGIINTNGKEIVFRQFDSGHGHCYIALNESKTKVYVTVPTSDSLHCFDISGKVLFLYKSDRLSGPSGVAVNKNGSVFVLGMNSCNIHRLSSEGHVLDIFSSIHPNPTAISCLINRDSYIVTHYSRFEICIFRTKEDLEVNKTTSVDAS